MSFHMSLRRRIAIATWSSPKEGNIYGKMIIDVTHSLSYIEYLRKTTGKKITITHLVGKAVGLALKECPDLNGRIFLGRYIPHKTVDLSFLVTVEGGKNLAKVKVSDIDDKSVEDIADELNKGSQTLREGKDAAFEKSKSLVTHMPTWILRPVLWTIGYVGGAMGLSLKCFGIEKFPFGAAIITNVGMFGMDEGYAPPTPFARVPIYLALPEIKQTPVVIDNQITIRPLLGITVTIDHRFLDGYRGAMIAKMIRHSLTNPWEMDGHSALPKDM